MLLQDFLNLLLNERAKKMELLNITVGGFRNIGRTTVSFDSITALAGVNGSGKSNLMDAIDFGFDFIHQPNETRRKMMASSSQIPILKSIAGNNYFFSIEAKTESTTPGYYVEYGFEFSWQTDKSTAKIVREFLNVKKDEKYKRYASFIIREEERAVYLPSMTGRCDKAIKIEESALVLTKLLSFDDLFYADILSEVYSAQYFVERHLDASPSFAFDPFVTRGFKELELAGIENYPRAIFYLKKTFPNKYKLLINAFKVLFPNVKDVNVEEYKLNQNKKFKLSENAPIMVSDNYYSLSILDDNMIQPLRFERLSDGTKRVFLMLTAAVIADISGLSLIGIEEPENSIHPSLLQSFLDVISQLVKKCKIIITSHSPYIIQYINPHSIYIACANTTGESSFERIAANKVKILQNDADEYGKTTGDYLFSILSSADAKEYLKEYLSSNG